MRKNAAGHGHRTRDRPLGKMDTSHLNELPLLVNRRMLCKSFSLSQHILKIIWLNSSQIKIKYKNLEKVSDKDFS